MIQKALKTHTQMIKEGWEICFPMEDIRYIEYFFRDVYRPEYTYVDIEDGKVVASAMYIPHAMMLHGRAIQTSMILGVYVLPEFRKQGRMKALMNVLLDYCSHNELITLIQAYQPELYTPYGFEMIYYRTKYTLTRNDLERITNFGCAYEPNPIDLLKAYTTFIKNFNGFYARDLEYFSNLKKEVAARRGKIVAYYNEKNQIQGYATLYPEANELTIEECVYADVKTLVKLLNAALQERHVVHLHLSKNEDLSVILPNVAKHVYGSTMVRLNQPELISRLFMKKISNVHEVFDLSRLPLNLNEFL